MLLRLIINAFYLVLIELKCFLVMWRIVHDLSVFVFLATRKFAIGDLEAFLPTEDNLESGVNPDPFESFKPSFFTEVVLDSPKEGFERREIWVPNKTDDKILPDEELLKLPFIQKVRALIASGQGDKVQLTISGAKLICKD